MAPSVFTQVMKQRWQWVSPGAASQSESEKNEQLRRVCLLDLTPCAPDSVCRHNCRHNPGCLHGLGQTGWLEQNARDVVLRARGLDPGSAPEKRKDTHLVGLKNLGATCYLNSLMQILFNNVTFRNALYAWTPITGGAEEVFSFFFSFFFFLIFFLVENLSFHVLVS